MHDLLQTELRQTDLILKITDDRDVLCFCLLLPVVIGASETKFTSRGNAAWWLRGRVGG